MDHDEDLEEVQRILNYRFRDITLLSDALTAAGADLDNYEGNRRLAAIGVDVIGLCLDFDAHQKKGKPSKTPGTITLVGSFSVKHQVKLPS
ncbi:hypothetical protein BDV33DRAFT_86046 [Aspergillus novoparasiticus]|uniref:Uncharacterized protein n=1 Tax=Aspergillus novoparasiticus TaxID=986946 RepID=A0A5N6E629_9EURO|nr:hypothetical protein BDV33DRAFT_86046 [Aspergillus novoparasiticus]